MKHVKKTMDSFSKSFSKNYQVMFFTSFTVRSLLIFVALALVSAAPAAKTDPPARLTDAEFWSLSQNSSEPGGYFRQADITNFTSNEMLFQHVIPDLTTRVKKGSVYLGVGPEQN